MKPYRGTILAAAALLATLSLSGCGDADRYKKTEAITLSTSTGSIAVRGEAIFTVIQSSDPALGFDCDTTLEYRAEGAGMDNNWYPVPGTESTRIFSLDTREPGKLSVMARGMCTGSKEDWKYSNQVDVDVTATILPKVTGVTLTAVPNPYSLSTGGGVNFTLAATADAGCTVEFSYQYSGAGLATTTVNPASAGVFNLVPVSAGTLNVSATGWCSENPTAIISSPLVTVPVNP